MQDNMEEKIEPDEVTKKKVKAKAKPKNTIVEDGTACACIAATACPICTENKSALVSCAKCAGNYCRDCFQQYLLNSTLTPTCMHCKASLSDDFVLENTKPTWRVKKYKVYRENLLFDMERARLPETQPHAVIYSNAKKMLEPALVRLASLKIECEAARKLWMDEMKKTNDYNCRSSRKLYNNWNSLKRQGRPDKGLVRLYRPIINVFGLTEPGTVVAERRHAVKACPKEGCKAFLNAEFKCDICESAVCRKCHEIMVEDHECNADTVETIKAIKAEAKGCPNCATLISKIDGCDQMWCTQCHVSFSWRTGMIEKGMTHNPHYYEWMRKNGGLPRNPGDVVGGCDVGYPLLNQIINAFPNGEITLLRAMDKLRNWSQATELHTNIYILLEYHRLVGHIYRFHGQAEITAPDNHDLRVLYLVKANDDAVTKLILQRRDKAYRKSLAKRQVYVMAHTVAGDIFRAFLNDGDLAIAKLSLENLFTYSNECLVKISDNYDCVTEKFTKLQGLDWLGPSFNRWR